MTQHVVIGTAGHVDHGKTALVKLLTGIDTDRWAEEKRRGITIDLGFASLDLGGGATASIVDVPGHEDFVRNMVAGATGVDVALLVVAADEGVMPQTTEHLAILEFLGVRTGVVAISKVDLVDPEWLELVEADVGERLAASAAEWEAPVPCSAVSGEGKEAVLAALRRAATRAVQRSADDLFRLPVDRAFSVAGAGTVVTGTTWSGTVGVGDGVRLLPGDTRARVRSVEVHGVARERAEPGRRTALALPGVEKAAAPRGCVVVSGDSWRETTSLDVHLTLLPESRPLKQRSRVRLHLGTAEVLARVTPAEGEVAPGTTGAARLRLERPVVGRWGDRGVVRSYSPVHTIGGCVVVDPDPPRRPRRPRDLERRAAPDMVARVVAFVELSGDAGFPVADLPVRAGLHPRDVDRTGAALARRRIERVGDRLFAPAVLDAAKRATVEALEGYHTERPLEPGMPRELLRAVVRTPSLADRAQEALAAETRVVIEGGTVRLAAHAPTLSAEQREWTAEVRGALGEAGPRGRTVGELGATIPADTARALAEYLVREGTAARVGKERYYDIGALEELRHAIVDELARRGRATPAELRQRTGLTRKYLIPVLEWLDGQGYTVRDGDARRLGPSATRPSNDA